MALGRAAQARLNRAVAMATYVTPAGEQAAAEFLAGCEDEVCRRTGRSAATERQLDTAVHSKAASWPLVLHVGTNTSLTTLLTASESHQPPIPPEVFYGLLLDGVEVGNFVHEDDGTWTMTSQAIDGYEHNRSEASDLTAWASELASDTDPSSGSVQFHPTHSAAATLLMQDMPTPPHDVPVVLLDLGYGEENPDIVTANAARLFSLGLAPVRGFDEVYPANFTWSYDITRDRRGVDHRIRITSGGRKGPEVYNGFLATADEWLDVEASLRAVVLIAGNFALLQHGWGDPGFNERAESIILNVMTEREVLGATIRRH